MQEKILQLIYSCIRETAEVQKLQLPEVLDVNTVLYGSQGNFDSLGLVNLIVAVEQAMSDELNLVISLTDERAMQQERNPFRTIGSLVGYIQQLAVEKA